MILKHLRGLVDQAALVKTARPLRCDVPDISVIVVVKNGERYLAQGLDSILAQTLAPAEIIVVIGESLDATAEIAHAYPTVRVLMQADQGLANARNLGIKMAAGELIAFLDHDDLWLPNKLAVQAEWMHTQPTVQYTTTWMQFLLEDESEAVSVPVSPADAGPQEAGTPSGLMARKALFMSLGMFDPAYQIGCDADWFVRARDAGIESAVIPEVLFTKRLHQNNLSRRGALNRKEMFQIARASLARQRGE